MRIIFTILLFAIFIIKLNTAKLGSSRASGFNFDQENAKTRTRPQSLSQNEKYSTMVSLLDSENPVIQMTSHGFRQLVFSTPRNYSCVVLLYNSASKACPFCEEAISSFDYIARSHYANGKSSDQDAVFFVSISMDQMKNIKLDVESHAPNFYYFSKAQTKTYNPFIKWNMEEYEENYGPGVRAGSLVSWIKDVADINIDLRRAPSTRIGSGTLILVSLVIGVLYSFWRHGKITLNSVIERIYGFNYKYACVVTVIWLMSGQMHNQIRGIQFGAYDGDGVLHFISNTQREQFLLETVIVMAAYGAMSYGVIKLIERKEQQVLEGNGYSVETVEGICKAGLTFFGGFVLLIYIIKMKHS